MRQLKGSLDLHLLTDVDVADGGLDFSLSVDGNVTRFRGPSKGEVEDWVRLLRAYVGHTPSAGYNDNE